MYHRNPQHPTNPDENHTKTIETTAEIARHLDKGPAQSRESRQNTKYKLQP